MKYVHGAAVIRRVATLGVVIVDTLSIAILSDAPDSQATAVRRQRDRTAKPVAGTSDDSDAR